MHQVNVLVFHFDCHIDQSRPSFANYLLFFRPKSRKKNGVFALCCGISIVKIIGCILTWYKNAIPQLRNCVVLELNQKVHCGSCDALQKLKN